MTEQRLRQLLQVDDDGCVGAPYSLVYGKGESMHLRPLDGIYLGVLCGSSVTYGDTSIYDPNICKRCLARLASMGGDDD